jgi:hypothetical protein
MIHINATGPAQVTPDSSSATAAASGGLLHAAGGHGVSPGLLPQEFFVEESEDSGPPFLGLSAQRGCVPGVWHYPQVDGAR